MQKNAIVYIIIYLGIAAILYVFWQDLSLALIIGALLLLFVILGHRIYLIFKHPKFDGAISSTRLYLTILCSFLCVGGFFVYILNETLYWPGKIISLIGLTVVIRTLRQVKANK